jgi:hypothetical protein
MKKLFTILAVTVLAFSARAQFINGPSWGPVLTNTAAYMVAGLIRTNVPITVARVIPVGASGVQLFALVGATNALTVTNSVATFEVIGPRGTNGLTAPTFTWSFPCPGTTSGGGRYTTNFSSAYVAAQANTALGNVHGLRLLHITNVNSESIWLTNLDWSAR